VPDVTGLDREAAQAALRERDFGVVVREQESDAEDPGEVLRQDPAPGTRLAKEEAVTIVVAVAPPEPEPEAPAEVSVPDVIDLTAEEAAAALRDAGFTVRRVTEPVDSPDEDGVVLAQDPGPAERRDEGSRVRITVGKFTPPEPLDEAPGEGEPDPDVPGAPTPDPDTEVP
jgi:serine/threonine-protein kinase